MAVASTCLAIIVAAIGSEAAGMRIHGSEAHDARDAESQGDEMDRQQQDEFDTQPPGRS